MTSRQRVLTTLNHQQPDRPPRTLALVQAKMEEAQKRLGTWDIWSHWDLDMRGWVGLKPPQVDWKARFGRYYTGEEPFFEFGEFPPEWGIASRRANFYHFSAPRFPLAAATSIREIESYPFPDYVGEWQHDHLEAEVQRQKADHVVTAWGGRVFQNAWYLRSREQLFVDAVENPAIVDCIFEKVGSVIERLAVRLAQSGIDILSVSDDIGMQDRMMISPDWWRRWVKPQWRRVFAAARKVNPDLHIFYHTDGFFEPVIPDLIEIGVTTLSTVQPECMDVAKVKRQWGRQVSLAGTIGVQRELRWGSPQQVKDMVRRQIETLGDGGGFILSPANMIEPDVPWQNLEAFIEASRP